MPLRFIEGRAGAGKTARCLEEIAGAQQQAPSGPPLLLLVPAQATFEMERALLQEVRRRTGRGAYARAEILSFSRLAWRAAQRSGIEPPPQISEIGRRMVLRALLEEHAAALPLFGPQRDLPGFIEKLSATFGELQSHCATPAGLRAARERLLEDPAAGSRPDLAAKLADLAFLLQAYQEYLKGRLSDPAEGLTRLAERILEGVLPAGTRVWLDGFVQFTPQEIRIIQALLTRGFEVSVTLTLPPGLEIAPPGATFEAPVSLRRRLVQAGEEIRAPLLPAVRLEGSLPRYQSAPLAALEAAAAGQPPAGACAPDESLQIQAAADPAEETALAAAEVVRLARDEKYRFCEIAILAADLPSVVDDLSAALRAAGVSFFTDRQRTAGHHPAVELVRSALEAVLSDWAPDPLFRFLKTDLVPVSRSDVDLLENHVLEWGIRGAARFFRLGPGGEPSLTDWRPRSLPAEEEGSSLFLRLDQARAAATAPLARLHAALLPACSGMLTCREMLQAIVHLLAELDTGARLFDWSREAEQAGDVETAQEHAQVWRGLVEVIEQAAAAMGDQQLSLRSLQRVMDAGLQGIRLGLIPAGLDQVQVGQIDRLRHLEARAVLLLGATSEALPRMHQPDVIFTDPERELLESLELELGPTSRTAALREQFTLYLAATRARERLYVSYPRIGADLQPVSASPLIGLIRQACPQLRPASDGEDADPQKLPGLHSLERQMVRRLAEAREGAPLPHPWPQIYNWLVRNPDGSPHLRTALAALRYANLSGPLPPSLLFRVEGRFQISPSGLESYARCPFRFYAERLLQLKPRALYRLEPETRGEWMHDLMARMVQRLPHDAEEAAALLSTLLERLEEGEKGPLAGLLAASERNRYAGRHLLEGTRQALEMVVEQRRTGAFLPHRLEQSFGPGSSAALPPLRFALEEGELLVAGRIDRIDRAVTEEGRELLRVVDYKSSPRKMDARQVAAGLELQLLLYMLALRQAMGGAEAAGAYYAPMVYPVVEGKAPLTPEAARAERAKKTRLAGATLNDQAVLQASNPAMIGVTITASGEAKKGAPVKSPEELDALLNSAEEHVRRIGGSLLRGEIPVSPAASGAWRACSICGLRGVCRFEEGIAGMSFRRHEAQQAPSEGD